MTKTTLECPKCGSDSIKHTIPSTLRPAPIYACCGCGFQSTKAAFIHFYEMDKQEKNQP
ncbi:MAG: hypothetical protein WC325_09475 [Candidatus Bathyarchaeia archaeon]|jgi:ribosomal protein L37AE/L43A